MISNGSNHVSTKEIVIPQQEVVTLTKIVAPLLTALGYKKSDIHAYNTAGTIFALLVKDKKIVVTVEPLNKPLKSNRIDNLKVLQKLCAEYGIITNGSTWILIKYDKNSHKSHNLVKVNLQPILQM
jgi:predicted type IV restriction endonuclease